MKKKIVLINGSPRAGKDTIASFFKEFLENSVIEKFAYPIKNSVKSAFGITDDYWKELEEFNKDTPLELFFGKTSRQVQITFSEDFLIKQFSNDVFVKLLINRIENNYPKEINTFIISDFGFEREIEFFKKNLDKYDVLVVKIFREGYDYKNDSRSNVFVDDNIFKVLNIFNNTNLQNLKDMIETTVKKYL